MFDTFCARSRYHVDIAALSETRFAEETQLEEVGGGYTYFCIGKPSDCPRTSGVGFAIRNKLTSQLESLPKGINDRLMTLRLKLSDDSFATVVSCYAPTMTNPEDIKEKFYQELDEVLTGIDKKDRIILLGDFNARVGKDHHTWTSILGPHGTGKCNSNGLLLLSLCTAPTKYHQHYFPTSQ